MKKQYRVLTECDHNGVTHGFKIGDIVEKTTESEPSHPFTMYKNVSGRGCSWALEPGEVELLSEDKATARPWHRNINAKFPIYAGTNQHNWKHVCSMIANGSTTEGERDANLELIVTAVNAHDSLLADNKLLKRKVQDANELIINLKTCINNMRADNKAKELTK